MKRTRHCVRVCHLSSAHTQHVRRRTKDFRRCTFPRTGTQHVSRSGTEDAHAVWIDGQPFRVCRGHGVAIVFAACLCVTLRKRQRVCVCMVSGTLSRAVCVCRGHGVAIVFAARLCVTLRKRQRVCLLPELRRLALFGSWARVPFGNSAKRSAIIRNALSRSVIDGTASVCHRRASSEP